MSDINRITCVDCGKHIVTEEREHVGGKIKVIEGSYENGYYDGEDDLFYCTECAKKNKWIWGDQMLKLTGNVGKSVIVDAIKKYNDARIYSYDKELIPKMESYHVNSDECSIKEFCEYILENIDSLSSEQLPVNMVVIYTNLTDKYDITIVEDCANTLEFEGKVGTVVVTSKI